MRIKRWALVFGTIVVVILMTLGFVNFTANLQDKETIFIEYVRKKPKRTVGACVYEIGDHTFNMPYPWPDFANVKRITFLRLQKGLYRIKIETYAPIPINTKDRLSFTAYFNTPLVPWNIWDTGVIYASKNYPFSIKPPSPNGGVFRTLGPKPYWVGGIKASVNGSVLVIDFASELVGNSKKLEMVVVHYLPADITIPPEGVDVSLGLTEMDVLRVDPALEDAQIAIPGHP